MAPTSCDSTSYCKPGCCFDSQEGLCMENTPQRVCEATGNATWADSAQCNIPQCNLGCCVLGDQGAFVTLTRCKQMSGFYGLKTDFRKNVGDELSCIAAAQGEDRGACVFQDPETASATCKFTTRSNCQGAVIGDANNVKGNTSIVANGTVGVVKTFHKDILCTAEELGTNCAPSTKTSIVDGKDEVYFVDTCGNIANIYDASRYNDKEYWKKVFKKSESCGAGSSNANSATCGNCDYFYGSIGRKASRSTARPIYGNYICLGLNCKKEGKKHGESWCVSDSPKGEGLDTVGSRYYKEVCLFGEVITEPCADFRNEICVEGSFGSFSEAACRVNRWQDCLSQEEQADCENTDTRDCLWVEGFYFSQNSGQIEKTNNDTKKGDLTPDGLCVPYYPPGFSFWGSSSSSSRSSSLGGTPSFNSGSTPSFTSSNQKNNVNPYGTGYVDPSSNSASSSSMCSIGNAKLVVNFQRTKRPFIPGGAVGEVIEDIVGEERKEDWECADGIDGDSCRIYLSKQDIKKAKISEEAVQQWAEDMNNICFKLGDCGGYINWQGKYTDDGFVAYLGQSRVAGSGGSKIKEKTKPQTGTGGTPSFVPGGSSGTGSSSGASSTADKVAAGASAVNSAGNLLSSTSNVIKDLIKNVVTGEK